MTGLNSISEQPSGHAQTPVAGHRNLLLAGCLGALIALLLALFVSERLDRLVFDNWQRSAPRDLSASDVRVVVIDGESLAELGAWPWPRAYIAALTEEISAQRPKVIGFDMIFAEPDRLNPENFANLYPELPENTARAMQSLPSMDGILEDAVSRHPVVLGRAGLVAGGKAPEDIVLEGVLSGDVDGLESQFSSVLANLDALDGGALGRGMLNGQPDGDGVVRHVPLAVKIGAHALPGFAMELARLAQELEPAIISGRMVRLGDKTIPIDARARMQMRFGNFPARHVISAADVFRQGLDPDFFSGKVVLVGLAAEGTADIVATPLVTEGYGIFVQAQAADLLMRGGWLARPAWARAVEWGAGLALLLAIFLASFRQRRIFKIFAMAIAVAIPVAAWLAFGGMNLLVNPLPSLLIGCGAVLGVLGVSFVAVRRERERLRAQLIRDQIVAAAMEGELQAARSIQMGMLPDAKRLASVDVRLEVVGRLEAAKSVGGDFFDIFRLDADHLAFVIADVTGKGVPAALFMALSKALTKSVVSHDWTDLAQCVSRLNTQLMDDDGDLLGLTMLICIMDLGTGALRMANAGHENPLVIAANGDVRSHAMEGGPPLCVIDYPYPTETMQLQPGETLVLLTDGVTEALDAENHVFGINGASDLLGTISGNQAANVVDALAQAVRRFEGGGEASDDMTIMAVRYLGSGHSAYSDLE